MLEIKIDDQPKYRAAIEEDPAVAAHTLISARPDAERVWVRCANTNSAAISTRGEEGSISTERCEALDPIWIALHRGNRVSGTTHNLSKVDGLWFGGVGATALNCAQLSKYLRRSGLPFEIQQVTTLLKHQDKP